jgi:hypothetical protein
MAMEPIEARAPSSTLLLGIKMLLGAAFVAPAVAISALCLLMAFVWLGAKLTIKRILAAYRGLRPAGHYRHSSRNWNGGLRTPNPLAGR